MGRAKGSRSRDPSLLSVTYRGGDRARDMMVNFLSTRLVCLGSLGNVIYVFKEGMGVG